jgi:hypothetical protein
MAQSASSAAAAAAPAAEATPVAGTPLYADMEQAFLACAPANMPSGELLVERAPVSYEPNVKGEYTLTEPVHEVKNKDASVWLIIYHIIHAAVHAGQPPTLPSSHWAGIRAVDLIPFLPMNMTYRTLVRFIEAGFHKIDAASGQVFRIYAFMLEHPVLNPEGDANDFSHFFPPGILPQRHPDDEIGRPGRKRQFQDE